MTAAEAFGPDHHPDIPDLMAAFRTDLGPIEACASGRIGQVRVPVALTWPRSGDHTPSSRLWLTGPATELADRDAANVLDIAPTVLALLGVPCPPSLRGRSLVEAPKHA